jgi:ribosome recycling factor
MTVENLKEKMNKTVEALQKSFVSVKAGRANPAILDNILVEYYGSSVPINQLANINVPDPQQLVIIPWEKGSLSSIEKSIIKANIGITPQNDGSLIRLPIPPLTQERRKDLVKQVKQIAENSKNSIRGTRREGNQEIKEQEKNKEISEDISKDTQIKIQDLTDDFIKKIDHLLEKKTVELTEF